MLDEAFSESFLPPRAPRVLGLRLRPLSHWHLFLLEVTRSPFTGGPGRLFDFAALYLAARICQFRYPERPSDSFYERALRRFVTVKYARRWLNNRRFRSEQLTIFSRYVELYCEKPTYAEDPDHPPELLRVPWLIVAVAQLLRNRVCSSLGEAWDFSPGQTFWLTAGSSAARGHKVDILTPEDRAQLEEIGERD